MPIDQHGDAVIEGISIRSLPKVSLHDHLDGGVRPATIIELGGEIGLDVPDTDPDGLAAWFAVKSDSGSLVEYLKTFDLTTAVMQTAVEVVVQRHLGQAPDRDSLDNGIAVLVDGHVGLLSAGWGDQAEMRSSRSGADAGASAPIAQASARASRARSNLVPSCPSKVNSG